MTSEPLTSWRELDVRQTSGVQVRLLWDGRHGGVWVAVIDLRTGDSFRLLVRDGESAIDVFNHPYAYAALHGVHTASDSAEPEYALS